MKQLNKWQSWTFIIGGVLMVLGVGAFVFMWHQSLVCWIFLVGALMFSSMQLAQTYEGHDPTLRRLKRIQSIANLLFIFVGILMADNVYGFFRPLFSSLQTYHVYLYNKWVILLLIAAITEVYTVHRIDHEISKKNIKE